MKIFDSHCHINDPVFDNDIEETIERANQNGISQMMIAGVTLETCKKALVIINKFNNIYMSVGIHPHDAKTCSIEIINELKDIAKNKKVKAWGEIGLDFNRMHSPQKIQEKWLRIQMDEANSLNLPLIFHERDTNGRLLEIIKSKKELKGVIHCFSGTKSEMKEYLDLGLHIGITGVITILQRGKNLREIANYIPDNRILIETDAPYLTPTPQRNKFKRNEPSFLPGILKKIAEVKNKDIENLSEQIFQNTINLFNIEA